MIAAVTAAAFEAVSEAVACRPVSYHGAESSCQWTCVPIEPNWGQGNCQAAGAPQ